MAGGFTGAQQSATEEYNGSSWSSGGNLIQSRNGLAGSGTQNATLVNGGSTPTIVSCTEEYNGSSWSSGGARIVACLLYTSPSPRDGLLSRMPSSA